jgi:hypothetical protein
MGGGEDSDLVDCDVVRVDQMLSTLRRKVAASPGSISPRTAPPPPTPTQLCLNPEPSTPNYQ